MTTRLTLLALLALPIAATADDKPAKTQRTLYAVRSGNAADLAEVLNKHFKGEAEVSALPSVTGGSLLISAPAATADEILKLLQQLDRSPKTVAVEVVLAEVFTKRTEDSKEPADPVNTELATEALAKLEALNKSGQLGSLQRIRLTAVEEQSVSVMSGGSTPHTVSVPGADFGGGPGGARGARGAAGGAGGPGGGGPVARSITYRNVGTTVKVTPRVGADNTVTLALDVSGSGAKPSADPDEPASFDSTTLATSLSVPSGRPVIAQAIRTDGKAGRTLSLVIVTARVVDTTTPAR
jgi:hypothetical protein